jgi:hypothetical protein
MLPGMTNRLAPTVALFLVLACGSSAPSPGAEGGAGADGAAATPDASPAADVSVTPDAPAADVLVSDTAPPADVVSASDAPSAAAVRFVLRNDTTQTIYLQDNAYWTLWRDGKPLRPNDTCEYCNCGGTGCAVCGQALPVTIAVAPGARQTWEWSGAEWLLKPLMVPGAPQLNLECEEPRAVAPGPLQVRASYSLSKVDEPPGSRIGPAINLMLDFQHPPAGEVVLVAK